MNEEGAKSFILITLKWSLSPIEVNSDIRSVSQQCRPIVKSNAQSSVSYYRALCQAIPSYTKRVYVFVGIIRHPIL